MNPHEIATQLGALGRELDALQQEYATAEVEAATRKRDAEVVFAKAYMEASGPVEDRKQTAILATANERFEADLAERMVKSLRKAMDVKQSRIDVGRSLYSWAKTEASLLNAGVS